METKYHISDREIQEISNKAEILNRYDLEFLEAQEAWKTAGGSYPTYEGKDLRRELTTYGIAKSEILKLALQDGADPEDIERILQAIRISGVDIYGTDQYQEALKILGSKETGSSDKAPERYPRYLNDLALRNIFRDLKKEGYLDGDEDTFVYIFGGAAPVPEEGKYVEVKLKNTEFIELVCDLTDRNNLGKEHKLKYPILKKYCRRDGKIIKVGAITKEQALGKDPNTTSEYISTIVGKIKRQWGY